MSSAHMESEAITQTSFKGQTASATKPTDVESAAIAQTNFEARTVSATKSSWHVGLPFCERESGLNLNHVAWMLYTGCSGSSFAYGTLAVLLSLFPHIDVWWPPAKEFLKNKGKKWVSERWKYRFCNRKLEWPLDPVERMRLAEKVLRAEEYSNCPERGPKNKTTIFFIAVGDMPHAELNSSWAALGDSRKAVFHFRNNSLDWQLCQYTDCFMPLKDGVKVFDSKGNNWGECFSRRSSGEKPQFKIPKAAMRNILRTNQLNRVYTSELYKSTSILENDERLSQFEYDFSESAMRISTEAFTNMLLALGVGVGCLEDEHVLKERASMLVRGHLISLREKLGKPRMRRNHSVVVKNAPELLNHFKSKDAPEELKRLFNSMWHS